MRIEFWVDYICPITFLTHQNLLEAIKELKLEDYEIHYRSYPLTKEYFEKHKNSDRVIKFVNDYFPGEVFEHLETNNTHQVAHLAKWEGKALEFTTEILNRNFIKKEDINNPLVLKAIAKDINLDVKEVERVIETACYNNQINNNKLNAEKRGIELIPHIRINMKHHFKGFYTKDRLVEAINEIINNKPKFPTECSGEICEY